MSFVVRGVPQALADEVRRSHRAPGYGHAAQAELATGTGPCRCCLRPFVPGVDRRLLFTYRPPGEPSTLMAPGPVFIHAERCDAWAGEGFPEALRALPLAFEARAAHNRVLGLAPADSRDAETQVRELFERGAEWLHLRHAEAGCHIARIDKKGPGVAPGA